MVLSFMLGDPEETLCGWICSAFLMTQMTTPGSPGDVLQCTTALPHHQTTLTPPQNTGVFWIFYTWCQILRDSKN